MTGQGPISQAEAQQLAEVWYRKLDVHAPTDEVLALTAEQGIQFVFPEATVEGREGLTGWYEGVIRKFFDEVHTVKEVSVSPRGDGNADVKVVVNWQAKTWDPPAAKSVWLGFDAYQTWVVTRSSSGEPVILTYIVDDLKPMPGSPNL